MTATQMTVKFGSLPVGTKFRFHMGITSNTKIEPEMADDASLLSFYKGNFWGWNAAYSYWDGDKMNDNGRWSVKPEEEVIIL